MYERNMEYICYFDKKSHEKMQFWKLRCRRESNIKMVLMKLDYENVNWNELYHSRVQ
jgi:hypothetical protein